MRISLYNEQGHFTRDLARKCIVYYAKPAVVVNLRRAIVNGSTRIVYMVNRDDSNSDISALSDKQGTGLSSRTY